VELLRLAYLLSDVRQNHRYLIRLKPESQILIPFLEHGLVRQKLIHFIGIDVP
jgi:hypothetical protein